LAAGIDTAAHLGTLAGGGHTVAVLGCGLDIQYPIRNLGLREKIAKTGTLISEFPFGRRADKQTFAIRNRIITGMADAVIVVETDICGGSILSANFANRQGKPLFAVPGRIGDKHSAGCNKLIRNGATLLENIDDIIDFLGSANYSNMSQMDLPMQDKSQHPELDGNEKQIFEILSENPKSVEEIAFAAHIDTVKFSCVLQSLRVKGLAKKEISGEFTRKI
jgi:DNA processing protein